VLRRIKKACPLLGKQPMGKGRLRPILLEKKPKGRLARVRWEFYQRYFVFLIIFNYAITAACMLLIKQLSHFCEFNGDSTANCIFFNFYKSPWSRSEVAM